MLSAVLSTKIQSVVSTGKGWHRHYSALTTKTFITHSLTSFNYAYCQYNLHIRKRTFVYVHEPKNMFIIICLQYFLAFMYYVHSYKCKFRVISQYKMPSVSVSNILSIFEQRCKNWYRLSWFTISIINIW